MPANNRRSLRSLHSSPLWRKGANFVLFQIAWFAAILLPAGWASASVVLVLILHLKYIAVAGEWRLLLATSVLGGSIDSLFAHAGIFVFTEKMVFGSSVFAPPWLLLLWANFASILCHSLDWLGKYRTLAFVLGAVAGPLAYWGGSKLTDKLIISVPLPEFFAALAPVWALVCVLLPYIAKRLTAQN